MNTVKQYTPVYKEFTISELFERCLTASSCDFKRKYRLMNLVTCKQHVTPFYLTSVLKHQEGAVTGQEVPGLLQASWFQTVGLLQLHGETHEETQHTSETAPTQQKVRLQKLLCMYIIHINAFK